MGIRKNFGSDSSITIGALGIAAYLTAVFVYQIIGHSLVCIIRGGSVELLTSVYFQCDAESILINTAGPYSNLLAGMLLLLLAKVKRNLSIHARFFIMLGIAFNLLWGAGSMIYSGITGLGDWHEAIAGIDSRLLWRFILIFIGFIAYYIAIKIASIQARELTLGDTGRVIKLLLIPYLSAGISACFAAWFYSTKDIYAVLDAFIQTFVFYIGFLIILRKFKRKKTLGFSNFVPVTRNLSLILFVLIVYSLFVLIMGRGIGAGIP